MAYTFNVQSGLKKLPGDPFVSAGLITPDLAKNLLEKYQRVGYLRNVQWNPIKFKVSIEIWQATTCQHEVARRYPYVAEIFMVNGSCTVYLQDLMDVIGLIEGYRFLMEAVQEPSESSHRIH